MRNKNVLRTLSVVAAALLCAVWGFAGCSSPSSGFGDDNDDSKKMLALDSLEIAYKTPGKQASLPALTFSFDKGTMSYQLDELEPYETVVIKPLAGEGIAVAITVDDAPFDNPAQVVIPKAGAQGKTVKITLEMAGVENNEYFIMLNPAQSNREDDVSLQSLFIGYNTSSGSLMTSTLDGSSGSAQVNDDSKSLAQAVVIAKAGSKFSTINFLYDGDPLAKSGGTGNSPTANIQLPDRQDSSRLEVVVTAANGSSKTYKITINGYEPSTATWYGTVASQVSGYNITKVTVKSAAGRAYDAIPVFVEDADLYTWQITTSLYYEPMFLTVNMEKPLAPAADAEEDAEIEVEKVQSKAYTLESLGRAGVKAPETQESPIVISVKSADIGVLIMNATQFKDLLGNAANKNKNFALGQTIDLAQATLGTAWAGPSGYAGQLYGNGHTVKGLIIKRTSTQVGLFTTLGDGAEIFDMNIEVSNENPGEDVLENVYMGGIVGNPRSAGFKIKNVTVSGTLYFKGIAAAGVGMIGGFIGEIGNANTYLIEIEKCVSNVNIILDDLAGVSNNTCTFGGFIAKSTGNVKITDSYAAGLIQVRNTNNTRLSGGGLIGDISGGKVVINRCYASGDVIVENNALTTVWVDVTKDQFAGGLVGQIKGASTLEIRNSAALNGKVLALAANTPEKAYYGRLYGGFIYVSNETVANTVTVVNTLARLAMITGKTEEGGTDADPAGEKDGEQQYQITTTSKSAGATLKGLGLADTEFKKKETWVTDLGWDTETWDFKKIAEEGRPRLK